MKEIINIDAKQAGAGRAGMTCSAAGLATRIFEYGEAVQWGNGKQMMTHADILEIVREWLQAGDQPAIIATYENCEMLANLYADANIKKAEQAAQDGLENVRQLHAAKADTAKQIANHICQFMQSARK